MFPDGQIFIMPCNPQHVWDGLDEFGVQATLRYICIRAVNPAIPDEPAALVGVLRAQREGEELVYYHTFLPPLEFFGHPGEYVPSDQHELAMKDGLLTCKAPRGASWLFSR